MADVGDLDVRRRPRRRRYGAYRTRTVVGVVVVVLAGGGGAAWAMSGSSGPIYRTASAQLAAVTQSLASVGTVGAVNKSVVTFPVSGHLASVDVGLGDAVTAGEVLATLDATALDQQVTQVEQTVASDQQKLVDDQASQTTTATTTALTTSGATTGSGSGSASGAGSGGTAATDSLTATQLTATQAPTGGTGRTTGSTPPAASATGPATKAGSGSSAGAVSAVKAAQAQLTNDQQSLDAILSDGSLADVQGLIASSGPCATKPPQASTVVATTDAHGVITVTTPAAATISATGTTVGAPVHSDSSYTYTVTGAPGTRYALAIMPSSGAIDAAACTAAIQHVVAELDPSQSGNAWALAQAVGADELTLASAVAKLEAVPAATAGTATSNTGTARTGTTPSTGSSRAATSGSGGPTPTAHAAGSTNTSGAGSGTGSSSIATPEQLVADQAAIDAANAELAVARQNVAQASIHAPIAGVVAANGFAVGASDSGSSITLIGPGAEQVSTTVSLTDLDLMKVGDPAVVDVDGISAPITGKVTGIGMLNSTTGSSTTYPVTVLLDAGNAKLFDGSGASVAITVGQVSNVLTVPSSAVHTVGTLDTVSKLTGGKALTTRVSVGAVGTDRTQITSGLKAGDRVVLAQLNAPLPSSGTTTLRGLGGTGLTGGALTGGLTGGGLTGGSTTRGGRTGG